MRLSCPEQMLAGYPARERLRIIRESGFDGVDVRFSSLEDEALIQAMRDFGLPLASVYSQIRAPSILDAEAANRAQAVADVIGRAYVAAEHGADNLILVPVFGEPRLALGSSTEDVATIETSLLVVALKEIGDALADVPFTIVIEPLNKKETHYLTDPTIAADLCARVCSPRVRTMVDTYHCFEESLDSARQIVAVGNQLALVHLSDSGQGLPGEGEVDFEAVLRRLGAMSFGGWHGLECRQI